MLKYNIKKVKFYIGTNYTAVQKVICTQKWTVLIKKQIRFSYINLTSPYSVQESMNVLSKNINNSLNNKFCDIIGDNDGDKFTPTIYWIFHASFFSFILRVFTRFYYLKVKIQPSFSFSNFLKLEYYFAMYFNSQEVEWESGNHSCC